MSGTKRNCDGYRRSRRGRSGRAKNCYKGKIEDRKQQKNVSEFVGA